MRYLLGIDNGGTFSKAALFDEEGRQKACVSVPTELITPKPGYTERDMEQLWQVNAQAVRQVLEKSGIDKGMWRESPFQAMGKGFISGERTAGLLEMEFYPRTPEPGSTLTDGRRMERRKLFMKRPFRKFWRVSRSACWHG